MITTCLYFDTDDIIDNNSKKFVVFDNLGKQHPFTAVNVSSVTTEAYKDIDELIKRINPDEDLEKRPSVLSFLSTDKTECIIVNKICTDEGDALILIYINEENDSSIASKCRDIFNYLSENYEF